MVTVDAAAEIAGLAAGGPLTENQISLLRELPVDRGTVIAAGTPPAPVEPDGRRARRSLSPRDLVVDLLALAGLRRVQQGNATSQRCNREQIPHADTYAIATASF
jgi:hypothetical protein